MKLNQEIINVNSMFKFNEPTARCKKLAKEDAVACPVDGGMIANLKVI